MKIAWLTDTQPPYREPMWRELSARSDLHVWFSFHAEPIRHWTWRETTSYRSTVLGSWTLPLPPALGRFLDERVAVLRPGAARRVLAGADALVIQVWWQPANLWCAVRARLAGIPYVLYAESTLQSRQFGRGPAAWVRSRVFRNAGAVLVPGAAACAAAVADGARPERVVESVNSIDVDLYRTMLAELRTGDQDATTHPGSPPSALPSPAQEHRFVYVGQLIERKNVATLIRAFAGLDGSPTLDIAGDGVEKENLAAVAHECGVAERVSFHGFLDDPDVLKLLSRTYTLVLPSTEEVYGFTALEGHVAGLQVVVSTRAGIAPNLTGRPGTWIVDPTEPDLRQALDEARAAWAGWHDNVDVEFASPRRAANDIIRAVELARTR